jgi:hypothetical protein
MITRIKELLAQTETDISGKWISIESAERFAELIVRECCDAANDWYQNHNDIHWDPAQHIKNCFGGDSDEFEKALAAARELQAELAKPEQVALDKKAENARELGLDYEPEQEPVAIRKPNERTN